MLDVDAVLIVQVRAFDAGSRRARLQQARWDVVWRLESTRGAGTQWTFANHGTWRRADEPFDPTRGLADEQDSREIVPVGGRGGPSFRDVDELVAHLHADAMRRLPRTAAP